MLARLGLHCFLSLFIYLFVCLFVCYKCQVIHIIIIIIIIVKERKDEKEIDIYRERYRRFKKGVATRELGV